MSIPVPTAVTGTAPKPFVFVLMPFDSKFDDIYKFGIKGAADDSGAYAERVDEQMYSEGILERIFNQINKADVIVADMTDRNPNVFYEVGYAHALNKPTILLTQRADDIPFDLKHRPHIVYQGSIDECRSKLKPWLAWAISDSRRRLFVAQDEQIDVMMIGVKLERDARNEGPLAEGTIQTRAFNLPLTVQNLGREVSKSISHVYLFSRKNSELAPAQRHSSLMAFGDSPVYAMAPLSVPIQGLREGLTSQFRLDVSVPALPPGAIEENLIKMLIDKDVTAANESLVLRLHTQTGYQDYPFVLKVQMTTEAIDAERQEAEHRRLRGF